MAFTPNPDSKSKSPSSKLNNKSYKMSAPPPSIIILAVISLLIAIPMIALSVVDSTWLNSMVAALVLLYHIVFLAVVFIHRKNFSSTSVDTSVVGKHEGTEDESFDRFDRAQFKPPSIAFSYWSIAALFFLFALNLITFSIMVNGTALSAVDSTLPSESHKWNIKIQMAQTTVIGCQLLTIVVLLGISGWGRRCIILEKEHRLQEAEYVI
jgi:hypothetical protein